MPVLKRNHRQIKAAAPIGGRRTQYRVEKVPGLILDVTPTGTRTWYVRYQPGGRQGRKFRWYKIGDLASVGLADAVKRAEEIRRKVSLDDRDPSAERSERRAPKLTFGSLYDDWYERHAKPRLARAELDQTIYRFHLQDEFAKRAIKDLKRAEIGRLRDDIAKESGPAGSNNVLVLINRVLNWAVDEGLIEVNPAARMRKAGQYRPRERVLSPDELRAFWQALAAMETLTREVIGHGEPGRMLSPPTRSILRLLALTGQRRGEVTGAEKTELQLTGPKPVWTIPGARTKNGLLHRVPLLSMAAEEFARAAAASPKSSPYVFASPGGDGATPVWPDAVTKAMSRLVVELEMDSASPHDLRRTVGTEMAELGIPVHVRKLILNHSPRSRDVTDTVYNRYAYDREKRDALQAWETRLVSLIAC